MSANTPDNRRLLTEKEVSYLYRVSLSYMKKKRLSGEGPPYVKVGRMLRYRPEDVDAFFATHLVKAKPPDVREDLTAIWLQEIAAGKKCIKK